MLRFIATHMTCVRIAPEDPMRAPTVVRSGLSSMNPSAHLPYKASMPCQSTGWYVGSGLSSMNPSAHRAQPEYELSTVMTTGMSAPPMEAVM